MQLLTPQGQNIINDIANRYRLSFDSAVSMLVSVNNGGGSMAQFSCPELGSGQWMRGGMTMVGDLFNHGLKNTVNNLCNELSNALANNQMFQPPLPGTFGGNGNNWWPGDLGSPSSSGGQNNIRYAFFPQARRLAVQRDGQVSVFDTQNHNIGGVSQQQGGNTSLTFTSQFGTVSTLSLPLVSGPGFQAPPAPTNFAARQNHGNNFAAPIHPPAPQATPFQPQLQPPAPSNSRQDPDDLISMLEKLGELRDAGILTDEEFQAKKTDVLSRL